jgi:hypothetical protein
MFGMAVAEQVACGSCGAVTHRLAYSQFFHIVHAAALRGAAAAAPRGVTRLETLLHGLLSGDTKRCDRDERGCGQEAPIRHSLSRAPSVFTISLAWDTAQASEAEVAATMAALGTTLRPERVFRGAASSGRQAAAAHAPPPFELRALVCYYGSHYASFARTDEPLVGFEAPPAAWTRFDDASVTHVGGWQAVCDACARGHLQPTVLFYEEAETSF